MEKPPNRFESTVDRLKTVVGCSVLALLVIVIQITIIRGIIWISLTSSRLVSILLTVSIQIFWYVLFCRSRVWFGLSVIFLFISFGIMFILGMFPQL